MKGSYNPNLIRNIVIGGAVIVVSAIVLVAAMNAFGPEAPVDEQELQVENNANPILLETEDLKNAVTEQHKNALDAQQELERAQNEQKLEKMKLEEEIRQMERESVPSPFTENPPAPADLGTGY